MNPTPQLIIHAVNNVRLGGGYSLLIGLLKSLPPNTQGHLLVDARVNLSLELPQALSVERVSTSLGDRLKIERKLKRLAREGDRVLCLGNLPPLFKNKAVVSVFVQNRHLVENSPQSEVSPRIRLRTYAERRWLSYFSRHADEFIVQSPTMRRLLEARIGTKRIRILPFSATCETEVARSIPRVVHDRTYDFIYASSGEPHKNHRRLIEAWIMLAKEGHFPSLCLTIDPGDFPELCNWIRDCQLEWGLRITNPGRIPADRLRAFYSESTALIFPSLLESLGLPLIEARQANLSIVASELDYVRDLLDPEETFDPSSATSIARAAKRFLGIPEQSLSLLSPGQFLEQAMDFQVPDRMN